MQQAFDVNFKGQDVQVLHVTKSFFTRERREFVPMRSVGGQAAEGVDPGLQVLRRDVGDGHHVLVNSSLVSQYGIDG